MEALKVFCTGDKDREITITIITLKIRFSTDIFEAIETQEIIRSSYHMLILLFLLLFLYSIELLAPFI